MPPIKKEEKNTSTTPTMAKAAAKTAVVVPSKKAPWFLLNDTKGNPSMSATFATIAFFTTTTAYMVSMFETIGPLSIRSFDVGACSSYLIPVLTLYFGRRWTDSKNESNKVGQ